MVDRTHSFGVMCERCKGVILADHCACGGRHGYTYGDPRQHPTHDCRGEVRFEAPSCPSCGDDPNIDCSCNTWRHA